MNIAFVQSALAVFATQGLPLALFGAGMFPVAILIEAQVLLAFMGPMLFQ